jgi:hypothetical protein
MPKKKQKKEHNGTDDGFRDHDFTNEGTTGIALTPSDEEIEKSLLGFCCALNCKCSEKHKVDVEVDGGGPFITPGDNSLWHRRCCHNVRSLDYDWFSPIEKAFHGVAKNVMKSTRKNSINKEIFTLDRETLRIRYNNVMKRELKLDLTENRHSYPFENLKSNGFYRKNLKDFELRAEKVKQWRDQYNQQANVLVRS